MTSVNTRANHAASVQRLTDLSTQIDALQAQISTTKRVNAASDDPVAFTRAAVLRRADAASAVTQRGIDAASRRLTATDSALEGITALVQRSRELALAGSNGTLAPEDRGILATEVKEIYNQFKGLADSRGSDGERLFGGAVAAGPAYALDASGVMVWQGGGEAPAVDIDGSSVAGGLTGPQAFGVTDPASGAQDLFATLTGLIAGLSEPDEALRQPLLETALTQIDAQVTRLADSRAIAGARLARLEADGQRLDKTSLATKGDLSKLEDLDLTEAIARMQRLVTVLQAAQGSFVKTANLSLWDLLR